VRLRHKIEKRSAEKQRKERKDAKKHPELHRKKPAALNIPNSFPYKDQILSEIEEARRLKAEEQAKRKEEAKKRRKELQGGDDEEVLRDVGEEEEGSVEEVDDEMDVEDSGDEKVGWRHSHLGA
jgi:nuclear GTP-binding protein